MGRCLRGEVIVLIFTGCCLLGAVCPLPGTDTRHMRFLNIAATLSLGAQDVAGVWTWVQVCGTLSELGHNWLWANKISGGVLRALTVAHSFSVGDSAGVSIPGIR